MASLQLKYCHPFIGGKNMRVLKLALLAVVTFLCPVNAGAQEPLFLVDRSGSTALTADLFIEMGLLELGDSHIEIVPWNSGTTESTKVIAEKYAQAMPRSSGVTPLGSVLGDYSHKVECRHLIVVVDGRADDMDTVKAVAEEILVRNHLTILVFTSHLFTLHQYENISDSRKYSVRRLELGVMADVYQSALSQEICTMYLG
jgi:hypothetical protein